MVFLQKSSEFALGKSTVNYGCDFLLAPVVFAISNTERNSGNFIADSAKFYTLCRANTAVNFNNKSWFTLSISTILKTKAPYIFAVAIAFILFQLYILLNSFLLNSFPAVYPWFSSVFTAEIGLIIRFVGACLFATFAWILLRKKEFSFSILRKAILLEGTHYLFYTPFIIHLFTRPASAGRAQTVYYEPAISYALQTIIVFSTFVLLYAKMRRPNVESTKLFKWGAIAVTSFVFSLWVKHFLFNLYALPIDLASPVLVLGLLNSTLTMLTAALILLFTFLPVIKKKTRSFSSRAVGIAFILIGVYFIIYILVALANPGYMACLGLTELWAITFAILGTGFLIERESKGSDQPTVSTGNSS